MTSARAHPVAFALAVLPVIVVSGCSSSSRAGTTGTSTTTTQPPAPDAPRQVEIIDSDFRPGTITINRGETIAWLNEDAFDHWVISAPGTPAPFDLGRQGSAASASHTFDVAGTFPYYCNLHNFMKGEVIVR